MMSYILPPGLRKALIDQLDGVNEDLCIQLEGLTGLIPGSLYTKIPPQYAVHIKPEIERRRD